MRAEPNSMGEIFSWWKGVVEDRHDPLMIGRLRVRILGIHTEDKTLIPTDALFWAHTYQDTTSAGMNGIGRSPTGIVEGSWVFGFFNDSISKQDPVVLGVIPGIPQAGAQSAYGFSDPGAPFHDPASSPRKIAQRSYPNDGTGAQCQDEAQASTYPRTAHPLGCVAGEPDTNRLARGEKTEDTIIGVRNENLDKSIPIAPSTPSPSRQWSEPKSPYAAQYPFNHVFESESGHVFEIDDTPGAERLHFWHRSGTFVEIQGGKDGDFVLKVAGKRFEVTMEQSYAHYQNTANVTVDGECNIYCRSNANLQVDGNLNVNVGGDVTEKVKGNYITDIEGHRIVRVGGTEELDIQGSRTTRVGNGDMLDVQGDAAVTVSGDITTQAEGNRYSVTGGSEAKSAKGDYLMAAGEVKLSSTGSLTVAAGGSITEAAGGSFSARAGGTASLDGSAVHLNSGVSGSASPDTPTSPASPDAPTEPDVPSFPAPLDKWTEQGC